MRECIDVHVLNQAKKLTQACFKKELTLAHDCKKFTKLFFQKSLTCDCSLYNLLSELISGQEEVSTHNIRRKTSCDVFQGGCNFNQSSFTQKLRWLYFPKKRNKYLHFCFLQKVFFCFFFVLRFYFVECIVYSNTRLLVILYTDAFIAVILYLLQNSWPLCLHIKKLYLFRPHKDQYLLCLVRIFVKG